MVTAVEVFRFPATGQRVRTLLREGQPWFVLNDVGEALELANPHSSAALLDDDERALHSVENSQGEIYPVAIISEAGLYSLILRSRKPEAKAFKRWVTHEVLPTIRRTGRYEVTPTHAIPQSFAEALQLAADQAREIDQQREQLAITAPKAEAWEVLASAHGDYSVREAAFILNRDPAIDTGQNRLFRLLRDWGLIDRRGVPYASHAQHVRLRARHFTKPSGAEETAQQVRITAEGLRYLHRRLGGTEPIAA